MAKNRHNKAYRYDLNQISYYTESTYDYIPLFWNFYAEDLEFPVYY